MNKGSMWKKSTYLKKSEPVNEIVFLLNEIPIIVIKVTVKIIRLYPEKKDLRNEIF